MLDSQDFCLGILGLHRHLSSLDFTLSRTETKLVMLALRQSLSRGVWYLTPQLQQ